MNGRIPFVIAFALWFAAAFGYWAVGITMCNLKLIRDTSLRLSKLKEPEWLK